MITVVHIVCKLLRFKIGNDFYLINITYHYLKFAHVRNIDL
jgi:hypothetical protein